MNSMVDGDQDAAAYQQVGIEHISPISGKKSYYPVCAATMKPAEGMIFDSLEAAKSFYQRYALASGFSIRKATQWKSRGMIKGKYFVCTKEGQKTVKAVDTLDEEHKVKQKRRRSSQRTGCEARIRLEVREDGKFELYNFVEAHNHPFVNDDDMHFISAARNLSFTKKTLISDLSTLNIGPVRAFNIMRTMFGGFDKVGATKVDCKNFKKDQNLYIKEYDAEMVVQRLMRKKDFLPNFSCNYYTDEDGVLRGLFWADEDAKRNFYTFGDVVSFDATYRHNKYNLVFVPFTGIDNHNCNVTLGAALLGNETAETYTWLLKSFKDAFGHAPQVVVTDQDPAMKKAIEDVFTDTRHRLCMWHIMDKLSAKVGSNLCNKTDFKERLCNIVWTDQISTEHFEKEWGSIMNDFELTDHDWLNDIYRIRNSWIPAFYRDQNMSGLMRTSSRSESENHFFSKFFHPRCTLVEFLAHFDSAIEHQRYEHRRNDYESRYKSPDIWSDFPLEKQAAEIYTRNIFLDVQSEIDTAIHKCQSRSYHMVGDFIKFFIKDMEFYPSSTWEVMIRKEDLTVYCSCKRFEQFGLLCRHIFCVLRLGDVTVFPRQYIMRRWTKDVVANSPLHPPSINEGVDAGRKDVYSVVRDLNKVHDHVINQLVGDTEKLNHYVDYLNQYKIKVDEIQFVAPPPSKRDMFADILKTNQPTHINIRAPTDTRNKGCGVHNRLRSAREQAISQAGKPLRACKTCGEPGHDSRNHHKFHPEDAPYKRSSQPKV